MARSVENSKDARLEEYVRQVVASAPPLTEAQRMRIAALLGGSRSSISSPPRPEHQDEPATSSPLQRVSTDAVAGWSEKTADWARNEECKSMSGVELPPYHTFHWPMIVALRELGGSASIEELNAKVLGDCNFTEEQIAAVHKDGPLSEIEYRLAWGRTYLKGMGLAVNSQRGVWSLTDRGRVVAEPELGPLRKEYLAHWRPGRQRQSQEPGLQPDMEAPDPRIVSGGDEAGELAWQDELLDALMQLSPGAFERLAQRLLREAGFVNARVLGRSGDGGIDGVGVYRVSLVSFRIFFQCKRYSGRVGPGVVRDFRGAMAGRGDMGLLITTGYFSAEAQAEATRDGAPPIDLIDGSRLAGLLKQYELGVRVKTRTVEDVEVVPGFFAAEFE